jgi:hypothetical protein
MITPAQLRHTLTSAARQITAQQQAAMSDQPMRVLVMDAPGNTIGAEGGELFLMIRPTRRMDPTGRECIRWIIAEDIDVTAEMHGEKG